MSVSNPWYGCLVEENPFPECAALPCDTRETLFFKLNLMAKHIYEVQKILRDGEIVIHDRLNCLESDVAFVRKLLPRWGKL